MPSPGKQNRAPSPHSNLSIHCKTLLIDESGQDLIEYALLAALVGLAAATSMRGLATKIGSTFTAVGSTLTSSV